MLDAQQGICLGGRDAGAMLGDVVIRGLEDAAGETPAVATVANCPW